MALVHIFIGSEQKAEIERKLKLHKAKIKEARTVVDTSIPSSVMLAKQLLHGNVKRTDIMEKERIAKENFHLAQRLFHIMGKPSEMSTAMHQQPQFNPQTLNFKVRFEEAHKINMVNQKIAEKLDAVKPTSYLRHDGGGINPVNIDGKTKLPFLQVLHGEETSPLISVPGHARPRTLNLQQLSAATDSSIERLRTKIVTNLHGHHPTDVTTSSSPSPIVKHKSPKPRKPKIILECTKEQGEYMIDTVVMKEPFRDRFAIFGIDVISGQRFELFIPSEAVFNILEGEMLVTSLEKKKVWREVLHRVTLNEVERFSKIKIAKVAMGMHPSLGPSNHSNDRQTAITTTAAAVVEPQGMKEKEDESLEDLMRGGMEEIEEQESEQHLVSHNNHYHNNNNNNNDDISNDLGNNNNNNDDDNNRHVIRVSALQDVDDLNVWEVPDDDELIDMHDDHDPLYDVDEPARTKLATPPREALLTSHEKTAPSLQITNGNNVSSLEISDGDNAVLTTVTTKAADDVDVTNNTSTKHVITSLPRQPHPPTLSIPSEPTPQAPSSSAPSGKRGNGRRQVHAMARLAAPTNNKRKAMEGLQPTPPQPPQLQQQRQPAFPLKPQPPSSSNLPSKGPSRPPPRNQPPQQRQQRRNYITAITTDHSESGIGEETRVGMDGDQIPSTDAPSSTAVDPIQKPTKTTEHLKESIQPASIQPIPTKATIVGVSQELTTELDTNGGSKIITTMSTAIQPSDDPISVPDWEVHLHKRKVPLPKHTVKKKQVDTSAIGRSAAVTTAVATAAAAAAAKAVTTGSGTVKSLHKPQPPTKPKSYIVSISTSSRPPPISISITPIPPPNISPPNISPFLSPLPSSSPKKSPVQNVLPGEERRLQLENRLKLIKREAALRRSQQPSQTSSKTMQQPSQEQQPSPPPQSQEVDNGAEYFTQLSTNDVIRYYSERQSNELGSQGPQTPPDGEEESVETITMSIC